MNRQENSKNKYNMTLQELLKVFCDERETLREYYKSQLKLRTFENEDFIDYSINNWIKDAKNCKNIMQFDILLRASLRMSYEDWFVSL